MDGQGCLRRGAESHQRGLRRGDSVVREGAGDQAERSQYGRLSEIHQLPSARRGGDDGEVQQIQRTAPADSGSVDRSYPVREEGVRQVADTLFLCVLLSGSDSESAILGGLKKLVAPLSSEETDRSECCVFVADGMSGSLRFGTPGHAMPRSIRWLGACSERPRRTDAGQKDMGRSLCGALAGSFTPESRAALVPGIFPSG